MKIANPRFSTIAYESMKNRGHPLFGKRFTEPRLKFGHPLGEHEKPGATAIR